MENIEENYSHINGWGIDADPENEPNYPIKKYTGDDHQRLNYERPPLQPETVEVLHSNERTGLSAVFGTPNPPSGLSGMVRRFAFKYSEGKWAHWLSLIMADRINAVEGIIEDVRGGHVPNMFSERGWKGMWKHNPKLVVRKVATGVLVTGAIVLLLSNKKKKRWKNTSFKHGKNSKYKV